MQPVFDLPLVTFCAVFNGGTGCFRGLPLPRFAGTSPFSIGNGGAFINWSASSSSSSILVTGCSVVGVGNGVYTNGGEESLQDSGEEHDIARLTIDEAPEDVVDADEIERRAKFRSGLPC
jgi:hypothetical protein